MDPLVKLQKRAVRLIAGVKKYEHTDPLFRKFKILKLHQIYIYVVQIIMYKYNHELLPSIFKKFFSRNQDIHHINIRCQNLYRPSLINSDPGKRTIRVTGVRTWNYFDNHICFQSSLVSYKLSLKNHLVVYDLSLISN